MALDYEHVRRLLDEVSNTKAEASAAKAQELLEYVQKANEESRRAAALKKAAEAFATVGGSDRRD